MRPLILYKECGWYTDTRMTCLHPLEILGNFFMHVSCKNPAKYEHNVQ